MMPHSLLLAVKVLVLLCCFSRCRRKGGCGGDRPSNGLCLTDDCKYRWLCCCAGCCCTRRRGVCRLGHGRPKFCCRGVTRLG